MSSQSESERESHGMLFIFSVRLTLVMEIVGFCSRFRSSLLWIQIYRLGVSYVGGAAGPRDPEFDLRNSFLSPATPSNSMLRQFSHNDSDDSLGSAIDDPAYYSSLFEDRQEHNRNSFLGQNDGISGNGFAPGAEVSLLKPSPAETLRAIDEKNVIEVARTV